MDSRQFAFPFYFRIIVNAYFFFLSCPLYFGYRKGTFEVHTVWIHKGFCFIAHILVLLFSIVSMSSLTFINLKKHPSELFLINNEVIATIVTATAVYIMWFKQTELKVIANIGGVWRNSRTKPCIKLIAAIIATLFPIICLIQTVIEDLLHPSIFKIRMHVLLTAVYLKPNKPIPLEEMEFETWEKVVGFLLAGISRYAGLVSSFTLTIMLFGGVASYEINAKLLSIVEEKEKEGKDNIQILHEIVNKFKSDYVAKVHSITKLATTAFIVHTYSYFSKTLVIYGELSLTEKILNAVLILVIIAILLVNAESVSTGRKIVKKVLLLDERLSSSSTSSTFAVSEIAAMKDLSSLGASGLFSAVEYWSLGYAFLVILQFAIIMLQFLEIEDKNKNMTATP